MCVKKYSNDNLTNTVCTASIVFYCMLYSIESLFSTCCNEAVLCGDWNRVSRVVDLQQKTIFTDEKYNKTKEGLKLSTDLNFNRLSLQQVA